VIRQLAENTRRNNYYLINIGESKSLAPEVYKSRRQGLLVMAKIVYDESGQLLIKVMERGWK